MNIYERLAELIANMELRAYQRQLAYFKPLPEPRVLAYSLEDFMPRIYIAKPDKARLVAVFVEPGEDRIFLHLVFDDEYFPNSIVDKIYRAIRKLKFGRTADVESVEIRIKPAPVGNFITTYCGLNIYETSVHFDGVEPYTGTLELLCRLRLLFSSHSLRRR